MMMFLHALGPASLPRVPHSRGVGVVYVFIKRNTIPGVKLGLDSRANIFGANGDLDALQDK